MKILGHIIVVALFFVAGFMLRPYVSLDSHFKKLGFKSYVFADPSDKTLVQPEISEQSVVILTLGQSNAANHGLPGPVSEQGVFNFWQGQYFIAQDPLLGASGRGSNMWTRVGELLLSEGGHSNVIIAPFAGGNTSIEAWVDGGKLFKQLNKTIESLKSAGLEPDYITWIQGETDNMMGTPIAQYQQRLEQLVRFLRAKDLNSPFIIARATRCGWFPPNQAMHEIQTQVADRYPQVFIGPALDDLGFAYRFDGCHFTHDGLMAAAQLWLQYFSKIKNSKV